MELKKDEAQKNTENTYNERPSVNDALFGNLDMDTPYQIQSTSYNSDESSPKKNNSSDIVKYAIIALIAIFFIGGFLNNWRKLNMHNGTYELVSASQGGLTYTVEELEAVSGMDIFASLKIKGSRCEVKIDYTYIKTDGVGQIKFDGNNVTIKDSSDTMKGHYNAGDKSITLESNGAELKFIKVD